LHQHQQQVLADVLLPPLNEELWEPQSVEMPAVSVLARGIELPHSLICAQHDVRGLEAAELITDERPPGNHNDHCPRATSLTLRRLVQPSSEWLWAPRYVKKWGSIKTSCMSNAGKIGEHICGRFINDFKTIRKSEYDIFRLRLLGQKLVPEYDSLLY
jgi:hypothetical protein